MGLWDEACGAWGDHVFASIQSLHAQGRIDALDPEHYDGVIVDEFHHAEAPTYERLLEHVNPRQLVGLPTGGHLA